MENEVKDRWYEILRHVQNVNQFRGAELSAVKFNHPIE